MHGVLERRYFEDPMLEVLRQRGLEHEQSYVRTLELSGRSVVAIDRQSPQPLEDTLRAMRDGIDVIVQARLEHGRWAGWADVLLKEKESESRLGSWLYEPVETKLARETRGSTLLQLCLYAELLAELQGAPPERLRVVVPDSDFVPECYRFDEFRAYFRLVRRNFEAELEKALPASPEDVLPYPEPVAHCAVCDWYRACNERWGKDDAVCLVAGIHGSQRKELAGRGVTTLAGLARVPLPLAWKPERGSRAALERVREQARVQLEARTTGLPVYELLLPIEEKLGLAALPPPSRQDMFLDLEGDRLAEKGGFDYLFGYAFERSGRVEYEALWALSPAEEKTAFESLIDAIVDRRRRDGGMHVYHYAHYETTALKRLMGKYGTRAEELDELLRGGVFVDLLRVVRKGLRAGVESYSIKSLEGLYGFTRAQDLRKASRHLHAVEYAIASRSTSSLTPEIRDSVRAYNRDDCVSALELRRWLERLRVEAERAQGRPVPRPPPPSPEVSEELGEHLQRIRDLADALIAPLPAERSPSEQSQWILAQLLEWHRREEKAVWWEFFRLRDLTAEELLEERAGISGLGFERRLETKPRGGVIDRYTFPVQETDIRAERDLFEPGCERRSSFATVDAIDLERRTVDLAKPAVRAGQHPRALFGHLKINAEALVEALLGLGAFVRDHGIDAPGSRHRAARDLLLRKAPRLAGGVPLRMPGEPTQESACRSVLALDGGVLAIQGPPGTGKTFTGARMIVELVKARRRVGITAVSHKVIRKLVDEALAAASRAGVRIRCLLRVKPEDESEDGLPGIDEVTGAGEAEERTLSGEYDLVGATAWHWAREGLAESVDVLFVDEAGQMSLANVLAAARGGRSLVLLGDPQQLEQPQQASHPEGSELSALEHLLEGHETMPEERGLFLEETRRLHPSICRYTSELFYEGRLDPYESCGIQDISGPLPWAGTGLLHVPVAHEGNQSSSEEEARRVAEIVNGLVASKTMWTGCDGKTRRLELGDILVIAPYNSQVAELGERLPGVRIGTVDKFQGQEAPVVIYSMTTSSAGEAPHGMEFLFDRHRMNVATSRARGLCILVGSPALFEPECRTPEQMRMANAFCRYIELARVVPPASGPGPRRKAR